MFRLAFTFAISITIGRWMYAEVTLNAPGMKPVLDYVLEATAIPTHDEWDKEKIGAMLSAAGQVKSAFAGEFPDNTKRVVRETASEKGFVKF